MPGYESITVGRVFIARWPRAAQVTDVEGLVNDLKGAHEKFGQKLIYVLLIPTGSEPVPRPAVRTFMQQHVSELVACCESINVVVEGSGVLQILFRGAMMAFAIAAGYGSRVNIFKSIPDAVTEVQRRFGVDAADVLRAARTLASERPPAATPAL